MSIKAISSATHFDKGLLFLCDEAVREYFTHENLKNILKSTPSQERLDEMANIVIRTKEHMFSWIAGDPAQHVREVLMLCGGHPKAGNPPTLLDKACTRGLLWEEVWMVHTGKNLFLVEVQYVGGEADEPFNPSTLTVSNVRIFKRVG